MLKHVHVHRFELNNKNVKSAFCHFTHSVFSAMKEVKRLKESNFCQRFPPEMTPRDKNKKKKHPFSSQPHTETKQLKHSGMKAKAL